MPASIDGDAGFTFVLLYLFLYMTAVTTKRISNRYLFLIEVRSMERKKNNMSKVKTIAVSAAVACFFAGGVAVAENPEKFSSSVDVKKNADGTFDSKITTDATDASGTRVKREQEQERSKTLTGDTKTVTKLTTTTDPKGLMNKSKEEAEQTVKSDGEGNSDRTLSSKSVDDAGTLHKHKVETETKVKSDGTLAVSQDDKQITDPKGLGNKTVVRTQTEKEKRPDGTVSTKVTKKVNGETVQDEAHVN